MSALAVIGAPSSAGAHSVGLEKRPEHYRRAGLVGRLLAAGIDVIDLGDVPGSSYVPDRMNRRQRNVPNVARVARDVEQKVDLAFRHGARPLIVGGDCTISIGMVASAARHCNQLGLVYVDAQTDLNTPETSRSGILDSMGLAHMIGLGAEELSRLGPRYPMITPEHIVAFGFHPDKIYPAEQKILEQERFLSYPAPAVLGRVPAHAAEAMSLLAERASTFVVHFDIDVVNFVDFPVADVPLYHGHGLDLDEVLAGMDVFVQSPRFGGLSVTELNPDLDPDGRHVERLLTALVPMLARGTSKWGPWGQRPGEGAR